MLCLVVKVVRDYKARFDFIFVYFVLLILLNSLPRLVL